MKRSVWNPELSVMGLLKAFCAVGAVLNGLAVVLRWSRGDDAGMPGFYAAVCLILWCLLTFVRRVS